MAMIDSRVLSAYLAPLLDGARVLYVGDLDDAQPLFEAGARLVHVYRFEKAARPLAGAVLVQPFARGLDLPTGGFDLAIVEDLGKITARLDLLAALRAGLGARGVAALVARTSAPSSAEANVEYTELYDACSTLFEHVKMVGQLPFTGTLLCELGLETEPDVSVDTELAEQAAPEILLALASQRAFEIDEYAIFAHPTAAALPVAPEPDLRYVAEISQLTLHNQALAAQLREEREVRGQAAVLARDLEAALAASSAARDEALQLRASLEAALAEQERVARGESETSEAELDKTLTELALQSERAEELEARAEASEARARVSEAKLAKAETTLRELERKLEVAAARAASAESRFAELESTVVEADARRLGGVAARSEDPSETELLALETRLRERGQTILELQAELVRRERMVTQLLLGERFSDGGRAGSTELEHKLDELARDVARRQGELEARGWRIQELETALAAVAKPPEALL